VILFSADVERASAFYRRLGFEETLRVPQALTADGVPGPSEPEVWLDHLLIAWIEDPDDHPIQLVQELGDG
jgi:catechol 2,3-dioxygenase-like lactoylglutathione lyase family enzyme